MEQEKITTNRIEEVLLQKKLKEYTKEITSAANNFANAVNSYRPEDSGKDNVNTEAFKKWVSSMFQYGWQIFVSSASIENVPDAVKEKILKQAVDEFIQSVESTKEVIDGLEY